MCTSKTNPVRLADQNGNVATAMFCPHDVAGIIAGTLILSVLPADEALDAGSCYHLNVYVG